MVETREQPKAPVIVKPPTSPAAEVNTRSGNDNAGVMTLSRREFNFSSLAHQIENGLAKGHSEREVIEAVI